MATLLLITVNYILVDSRLQLFNCKAGVFVIQLIFSISSVE